MSSQTITPSRTPLNATGPGARPGGEDALLVEHAVIGQLVLEAQARDLAFGQQQRGVVELAVLAPGRAQQHRRAAASWPSANSCTAPWQAATKAGFKHQILGRIARDEQLRGHHQIGALAFRFLQGALELGEIARDVAHDRVELGDGNGERIGHAA